MSDKREEKLSLHGLEVPFILTIIALFFWNSSFLLPIKLLTVFFHELSHGLATILTGGKIIRIALNINQGGFCRYIGGWSLVTLSAGYLGSLLWGAGILRVSLIKGINRHLTQAIGWLMLVVAILWMRDLQTLAITVSTGVALIYAGIKLKEVYCSAFLRFISLVSCFYVVFDIKEDLLDRTVNISDAYQISKLIFPSFMTSAGSYIIGLLWLVIAVYVFWKTLCYAFGKSK